MKRHPLDATSLISGLVFAFVASAYLVAAANGTYMDGRWLLPLALIGLGVAGVAGAITAAARQHRAARPEPVSAAATPSVASESAPADEPPAAD